VTGKLARIPNEPPADVEAEAAVLGAVLLGGAKLLDGLATEEGLRPPSRARQLPSSAGRGARRA
jgi:hypothetical protein